MKRRALLALLLLGLVAVIAHVGADEAGILEVRGRNAREKGYPIGKVEFLDISIADQLVLFSGGNEIPLRLGIEYNVLKTQRGVLA